MAKLIEKIKDKRAPEPETPERRDVPIVHPDPQQGLTSAQVRERTDAGWTNAPVDPPGKTVKQIVLSNIFTYFNMLFFLLALCVIAVQQWLNLTFMGVIIVNTAIGIVQELRSKKTLDKLSILASPKAVAVRDGKRVTVDTAQLVRDDIVVFAAGNQIYADAVVAQDSCYVNEALITGESDEIKKNPGDKLLSGSFVVSGMCRAQLTDVGADSYVSRLTQEAKRAKKPQQSEMMRALQNLVKWIGILVIPLGVVMFIKEFVWLDRAAPIAVTSTVGSIIGMIPEGLYLLTSLALVAGVVRLAQRKTLVHELGCIETLARVDTLCVDKTGTVTEGKPVVTDVRVFASHLRERDLLKLAASVEVKSEHPQAQAIVRSARENETGLYEAKDFGQQPGSVFAKINGKNYSIGNRTLAQNNVAILKELETLSEAGKTALVVCEDNVPVGIVACADTIKSDSAEAIRAFKAAGLRVMMLTGDNERTAKAIARAVGIDEVVSEVLPADKAAVVKQTQQQGARVLMIGDGINDAPALATADVGMAIGAGTDVAIECADVVLVNSKLTDAVSAYELSGAVLRNIKQNLFWAFFYNAIGIPVAAGVFFTTLGWSLNPMIGAAAMSMSSVWVVTNALRLRRFKPTSRNSLSSFSTVAAAYAAYQLPLEQRSKTMQKVISIEGMHCPHCSGAVTKALTKLAGVTSVDVSLEKKCAVIECEETVTDDVLKATIADLDFEVTGIETK